MYDNVMYKRCVKSMDILIGNVLLYLLCTHSQHFCSKECAYMYIIIYLYSFHVF